jgi:hypothetical protein
MFAKNISNRLYLALLLEGSFRYSLKGANCILPGDASASKILIQPDEKTAHA